MKIYDKAIVGAGASGMVAAIFARRNGLKTVLIEKNEKMGRKILMTGNGRCNISNLNVVQDQHKVVHYYGNNPKFVLSVLNKFTFEDTKHFFQELGIEFVEEDEGRLFPASNQAQSVVDVLKYELVNLDTKIIRSSIPIDINFENGLFQIKLKDGNLISCKKVIIATGGLSHPESGSSGDGYQIAKRFGHTILSTYPVYTGLVIKHPIFQKLQGTKLEAKIQFMKDKKVIASNLGTIMFAHYGLSAPGVLEISREASKIINVENQKIKVSLNFLPFVDSQNVGNFLQERWNKMPEKTLGNSFIGLLPKKVFPAILEFEKIDGEQKVANINKETRKKIVDLLTNYQFEPIGTRDFKESHFTAGGVNTKEVDPATLESKLQKGLYFCGEVLDIDGDCGGYNLQWAWSSGAVAGGTK